jgi:acyl-CoA synthetase (AMP-forming)/AMP-acid ligase II
MSAFAHIKTNPPFATIADLWDKRTEERSDKTYLHFQDRGDSYGSMRAAIARAAGMLKGLGAEKGNHVALLIPNSPEFLYLWFGAMTGGFTAVTINTLLKAEELEFIINDCDARILVTTPPVSQSARAGLVKAHGYSARRAYNPRCGFSTDTRPDD